MRLFERALHYFSDMVHIYSNFWSFVYQILTELTIMDNSICTNTYILITTDILILSAQNRRAIMFLGL